MILRAMAKERSDGSPIFSPKMRKKHDEYGSPTSPLISQTLDFSKIKLNSPSAFKILSCQGSPARISDNE